MAARFWVGGTGTADLADTTHWAATSGGAGGQSVPGSADTVTFDGSSGSGTVTIAADFNWSTLACAHLPARSIGARTTTTSPRPRCRGLGPGRAPSTWAMAHGQ